MQDAAETLLRDQAGVLRSDFMHEVEAALETGDAEQVRALTLPLHEADLADLIEALDPIERDQLIAMLGRNFDVEDAGRARRDASATS